MPYSQPTPFSTTSFIVKTPRKVTACGATYRAKQFALQGVTNTLRPLFALHYYFLTTCTQITLVLRRLLEYMRKKNHLSRVFVQIIPYLSHLFDFFLI